MCPSDEPASSLNSPLSESQISGFPNNRLPPSKRPHQFKLKAKESFHEAMTMSEMNTQVWSPYSFHPSLG